MLGGLWLALLGLLRILALCLAASTVVLRTLVAALLLLFVAAISRTFAIALAARIAALFVANVVAPLLAVAACRFSTPGCGHEFGKGFFRRGRFVEPTHHAREETRRWRTRRRGSGLRHFAYRRGTRRHDSADHGFFRFGAGLDDLRRWHGDGRSQAFVAGLRVGGDFGGADAFDVEVRRFEFFVGDDDHGDIVALFDLDNALALFVEQEVRDHCRHLHQHLAGFFLHCLLFDQAQHRQ